MEFIRFVPLMLAQEAQGQEIPSRSLIQYIHAGGTVTYLLVVISVLAMALIIRNLILIRPARLAPDEEFARLDSLLRQNDVQGAVAFATAAENGSFMTRVFGAALLRCARSPFGFLELRSALEESGQRETERLHRFNEGIGIIAAVAPMLGLLGTVIGMIGAFSAIGTLEGAARSHQLAASMSLALISTAVGLIVAIPCTVAFTLFRRRIDTLVADVADRIEQLSRNIEQAGAEGGSGQRPARPGVAGSVRLADPGSRGAKAS
jgi:biopolymer transport protein ExbB